MKQLQEKLGYVFRDPKLLQTALTHSSWANENRRTGAVCNERLEFLGDAILGVTVAEHLYRTFPDFPEGQMTKLRAELVCETSLAETSVLLGVGQALRLGRGEELGGGRERKSILADAFESILAAVYLDGGAAEAERLVRRFILPKLDTELIGRLADCKTMLQEKLQSGGSCTIRYETVGESGPDHEKEFVAAVFVNGTELGRGSGRSKKDAEQSAARKALQGL